MMGSMQGSSSADLAEEQGHAVKVMLFIRSYMSNGHLLADLDPLKMAEAEGASYNERLHNQK
jgi:2-oxoglutarate dehydrogenase complex dehydrogenase (E1) component-like enzyme